MGPRDLIKLLTAAFTAREPVLVTGSPGIGKTEIIKAAAAAAGAEIMISHPVLADPTDAKGLPWAAADGKSATFLPFGDLARALAFSGDLFVWFLDDLGQASPAVQASFMQLLLGGRVNGHHLPDNVVFVGATNRRTDRAGVQGILEPVKSRFGTIVELEPNVTDWVDWAINHNQPVELISFIRFRPNLLNDFKPTHDLTNSPCPRTWEKAAKWIKAGLEADVEFAALTGAVGEGAAAEFAGFLRTFRDLPDLDVILMSPDRAPIPPKSNPSALYAVSAGLATKANPQTFAAISKYAERMEKQGLAEFAILLHRDSLRRCPDVQHTAAFAKLCTGPLGRLIAGDV